MKVSTKLSSHEEVIVVDKKNRITGTVSRRVMRQERLIHRATYILVFNTQGNLLVQKRTETKDIYPGCLEIAAGGVVCQDESYEEAALRELFEETGIKGTELKRHFDFYFEDSINRVWGRLFSCTFSGTLTIQKEEVQWARFYTLKELAKLTIDESQFTPDSIYLFRLCHRNGLLSPYQRPSPGF